MILKLFKDGDSMGIQTDCETEEQFLASFSDAIQSLIENGKYEHDWSFQLYHWLPQFVDICNSYRGYKTTLVRKSVILTTGNGGDVVYEEKPLPQNMPRLNGFVDEAKQ